MNVKSLKQRLLGGAVSYGPLLMSDSPIVAELLAFTGYGHIIIDHEHSPTDVRSGQGILQAIQSAHAVALVRTEPIVRVPSHDPIYMKKALDTLRLPGGVLVPMVDDAETARAIVQSTRYPRQYDSIIADTAAADAAANINNSDIISNNGIRGCAVPFVRGSAWGYKKEYLRECQEDLLVMVQVETPAGVEAIPEIASVPGVDAIFLGPFDLSTSIGKMGQFDDNDVAKLLADAEERVRQSSENCLLAGFRTPSRDLQEMVQAGYSLICGSVDIVLLKEAARQDLQAANAALNDLSSK